MREGKAGDGRVFAKKPIRELSICDVVGQFIGVLFFYIGVIVSAAM